jgi:enoyl-CoA hydratase
MSSPVSLEHRETVAVITVDDGKANALSAEVIGALNAALDEVEASGPAPRAIVISGRDGVLSGGFDLKVMRGGDRRAVSELVTRGGELVLRLFRCRQPVVCACTGHAIAAGALVALGCHFRVGAGGDFRIGLIETAIGLVLPDWAVAIADERIDRSQVSRAVVEAHVYDPVAARAAGFLDLVVPADRVTEVAVDEAARLAALDPTAYAGNAAKLRGPGIARLAAAVARDRDAIGPPVAGPGGSGSGPSACR